MGERNLQLFGGDWTERKLDALRKYLRAYAKVLSRQPFSRVYIDAFAGTGYREQPDERIGGCLPFDDGAELAQLEPQEFLDGSARLALNVDDPPFDRFVFVELHRSRAQELEKLKNEFPRLAGAIEILCGDANATMREICRSWDRRSSRGVAFLDPYGMQLEWSTVEAIAETKAIDVWVLFPFAVNRLLTQSPESMPESWRARLTTMFGSTDWLNRFYPRQAVQDLFDGDRTVTEKKTTLDGIGRYYHERLKAVFPVVAPNPVLLRNSRNSPLFQLFFAAANPGRGGQIALQIAEHILSII